MRIFEEKEHFAIIVAAVLVGAALLIWGIMDTWPPWD